MHMPHGENDIYSYQTRNSTHQPGNSIPAKNTHTVFRKNNPHTKRITPAVREQHTLCMK